jgi:ERCC4-related helicase
MAKLHTQKAIERIRDYLVAQIKAMRSPNINAQIIQQQTMLKHKDLFTYLSKHHPQLAQELTQAYINTMRWYYLTHFSRYNQALEKIKLHAIDRNDLLGGEPASHRTGTLPLTPSTVG